jgi:uncharacterized membrane protein
MHIPDSLLSSDLLFIAYVIWSLILVQALRRAPWRQLYTNRLIKVFLGAVMALLLLWSWDVNIRPGLGFHFLGVTVFTLMFGWSLGVIGVSLATVGIALNGGGGWESMSLNALLFGALPVSISYGIYQFVDLRLPHHVFIYIYLCGFGSAILAAGTVVFSTISLLVVTNTYTLERMAGDYLPFVPLYLFPEGILNGMLTTVFVGLRPQWLKTFDDKSYLNPN